MIYAEMFCCVLIDFEKKMLSNPIVCVCAFTTAIVSAVAVAIETECFLLCFLCYVVVATFTFTYI